VTISRSCHQIFGHLYHLLPPGFLCFLLVILFFLPVGLDLGLSCSLVLHHDVQMPHVALHLTKCWALGLLPRTGTSAVSAHAAEAPLAATAVWSAVVAIFVFITANVLWPIAAARNICALPYDCYALEHLVHFWEVLRKPILHLLALLVLECSKEVIRKRTKIT